jgi:ATP adenylyltransferase
MMDTKTVLWAPWRMKYVVGEKPKGCFLCEKHLACQDAENLVLYRGARCYVILNLFPYNPGHLMVVPYQHLPSVEDLDEATLSEMMLLVSRCVKLLQRTMSPCGFNVGMNIGRVAGAGVAEHVHIHVVPRWEGDSNFMPVLSETKVIPEGLRTTYEKLVRAWNDTEG